ncbi:MAG: hypothetical protein Q8O37_15305 [Sulfuricellaceae bacterium]|nr:hypothetical protein [Sulfuricellaceae bacterium]
MLKRLMVLWVAVLSFLAVMTVSQSVLAADEPTGDKKNAQQAEQKAGADKQDKKAADDKSGAEKKDGAKGSEPDCQ